MPRRPQVVIIGAGPAAIFAALELSDTAASVRIFDKGPDIDARIAHAEGRLAHPNRHWLLCGWGGAGAFSDGKLTMALEVGGQLTHYLSDAEALALMAEADQIWLRFGAPQELYGTDQDAMEELSRRATRADLQFVSSRIRHLGTDRCPMVLREMRQAMGRNVEVHAEETVVRINARQGRVTSIETAEGKRYAADYVIAAPGREGSPWFASEGQRLGLGRADNPVDVGVRVEVPAEVMADVTNVAYESKLIFYSKNFDNRVRTFCMCPYGEVVTEENEGIVTVNGQSYAAKRTANTNFAILVSTRFTHPFHEPIAYGRYLASLANLLGGGVLVQRLGDLRSGHRSTQERLARSLVNPTLASATPGDLSYALPYRHLSSILYGIEVKFYSARPNLTKRLETEVTNLFAIGDGAGVTRGLVQSSMSGLIAGREVRRRLGS
jgi:uncharacterized FAD-dependent dehydrogenase